MKSGFPLSAIFILSAGQYCLPLFYGCPLSMQSEFRFDLWELYEAPDFSVFSRAPHDLSVPSAAAEEHDLLPATRSYPGLSDVSGVWCEKAVQVCYEAGLLNDTSETTFLPAVPSPVLSLLSSPHGSTTF